MPLALILRLTPVALRAMMLVASATWVKASADTAIVASRARRTTKRMSLAAVI